MTVYLCIRRRQTMAKYIQKLSFGIGEREWWVGWEITGSSQIKGLIPADSLSLEDLQQKGISSFQPVNPDLLARIERRSVQRVRLIQPFSGRAGKIDVQVVDVSAGGVGISHEDPLRPGLIIPLGFMAGDQFFSAMYDVLRCQLARGYDQKEARYYSALRLHSTNPEERRALAGLVAGMLVLNETSIRENPGKALALY